MNRRTAGKVSVASIVVLALVGAGAYFLFKYLPLWMEKASAKDIARTAAAKMVIEPNDAVVREFIQTRAKEKGLTLPPSQVVLRRNYPNTGMFTVELGWTHQMSHPWGSRKVMNMKVAEVADLSGGKLLKNAE